MKLTEKCLNSVGSSPVLAPLRPPEDLKSNILKAQAEAALKVLYWTLAPRLWTLRNDLGSTSKLHRDALDS